MLTVSKNIYVNDNGFVFNFYTGLTYGLNQTGTFILKRLQERAPVPEIARGLEDAYGIGRKTVASDVDEFLQQLASLNLISRDGVLPNDSV
jgi:hypothetical protein